MTELLSGVFAALGMPEGLNLATLRWVLPGYVAGLCLVCYGVLLLTRLHPAPQWVMFVMTLVLTVRLGLAPAGGSPFYSSPRIALNRALLLLPLIASCVYLLRPRFRRTCREFRER